MTREQAIDAAVRRVMEGLNIVDAYPGARMGAIKGFVDPTNQWNILPEGNYIARDYMFIPRVRAEFCKIMEEA